MKRQLAFTTNLTRISSQTKIPTMRNMLASFVLTLSTLALATFVQAAPFQNGSFELNGGNASSTATGWTQSNGPPIRYINSESATEGTFAASFNPGSGLNGAVLAQTFDTVTAHTYTVTFNWGNLGCDAAQGLRVEVRDATTGNQLITLGSGTASVGNGGSGVLIEENTNVFIISDSTGNPAINAPA